MVRVECIFAEMFSTKIAKMSLMSKNMAAWGVAYCGYGNFKSSRIVNQNLTSFGRLGGIIFYISDYGDVRAL